MVRLRLPERASAAQRQAPLLPGPDDGHRPYTARDLLLRSWAGRLFLVSAGIKLIVAVIRQFAEPPQFVDVLSGGATVALFISLGYFMWKLISLAKRRLLWRVRRKLIISYIFIGVIPAMLIVGFFLLSAGIASMSVSAYLFKDGYDSIVESAGIMTQAAASDVSKDPRSAPTVLQRTAGVASSRYPNLNVSLAFVPLGTLQVPAAQFGPWEHLKPPAVIPAWARFEGFQGTITAPSQENPDEVQLVIRAVKPARGASGPIGSVVMDILIDDYALEWLRERTSIEGGTAWLGNSGGGAAASAVIAPQGEGGQFSLFRNSVTFLECTPWIEAEHRPSCRATIATRYSLQKLWARLTSAQVASVGSYQLGTIFLLVLGVVAILFLLIQGVALLMGLVLARSITSAIHELFTGTERVQQGDFAHRIEVTTNDQLGELAHSFNQMTGSIEGLLQTAAEKKRLDEELRIARQIQMSLLPRGPLDVPGLGITALCVPAREVGGDYYDFFHLPDDRLGVLIADVAGKGTSAALYMAELKGLVLALSQTEFSPRQLLINVNRIISDNLDSRSFITMTYAVIDRRNNLMTYCRAGHTPLVYLSAPGSPGPHPGAQVLTPDGMVVGLRIPGAAEKFAHHLEEDRLQLSVGDVIVFYTDGITEAMNAGSDLFGEARLARIVEEHGHLESSELRERILREIEAFVGTADQHDDMTMILLKVEPAFVAA
jgi:phosphoserine phosphatase RsbU/P